MERLTDEQIAEITAYCERKIDSPGRVDAVAGFGTQYHAVLALLAERKRTKELLDDYVRGYWVKEGQIHELTHGFCFAADRNPADMGDNIEAAIRQEISLQKCLENIRLWLCGLPYTLPKPEPKGIYTASRVRHASLWHGYRAEGFSISATWIDEAGPGETADMGELWERCVSEARTAAAVVLYRENGEMLKGALVEVGAALGAGVPVFAVGCDDLKEYSWLHHRLVTRCATLREAMLLAEDKADFARIRAMTPEEVRQELEAEGIDLTETKRKMHERMQAVRESESDAK